jgi:hypothetical protein
VLDQAQSILAQHPLPSNLPALSTASNAHQTLAIDAHNTLFFSDDDGKHWQAVPSQWQGRAVKVNLASSTISSARNATIMTSNPPPSSSFGAIGGPISLPGRVASSVLTGTITDATGAAIPEVSVVVTNSTTESVHTVKTDRTGRYLIDDLAPGSYRIEAQAPGFQRQSLTLTLVPSERSLANLTLPIGQATEAVTVDSSVIPLAVPSPIEKKVAEPPSGNPFLPIFEITTDTGKRWTSSDGQTWKPK